MATTLGSVALGSYARYELRYDLLGQNQSENYSSVRLYGVLVVTGNNISWTRGSASVHTSGLQSIGTSYGKGEHTVITRDFNFGHDNNGNFSAYIGASISTTYLSGDTGGTLTLPTIARASQPSCITWPNTTTNIGNIGDTITIHMNRKSAAFTHTVRYAFGSLNGTIATNVIDNCRWTIPTSFYNQIPNSNSGTGTIYADTYNGSTKIGTKSVSFTCFVGEANPTFTDFDFKDVNSKTVSLTGNNQSIISGYSNIKTTISTENMAIAIKGASMSKYRLSVGENNSTDITYSSSKEVSGTVNSVSSSTINVYAIDSRNNSTLVSKQAVNFYTYNPLIKGNISLERSNNGVGENVTLTYNGTIDLKKFGAVTNSIKTATYTLQRSDSSTITTGETDIKPTVNSDGSFSFTGLIKGDTEELGFDIGSSYIITVTITDELSSITYSTNLGSGRPNIALAKNGVSIMSKYDEELGGLLQVGGLRFDNTYSEEEIPIGTWIDGKPIYRKVIKIYGITVNPYDKDITSLNIDTVVSNNSLLINTNGNIKWQFPNYYYNENDNFRAFYRKEGNTAVLRFNIGANHALSSNIVIVILEYTKTTDTV